MESAISKEQVEKALNDLINECNTKGGFVWIVDKKGNDFALRLTKDIKLTAYIPKEVRDD